jgi:7,8-dihydropterin-6-yl-methyl-4-(beta-D-ribofuranosyl)aminobenzene 5'-phosphate synthase
MRFTIVYDNEALAGFKKDWGFACLIGEHLLFDTGANYNTLLYNMDKLGIKLSEIDTIVLSHFHGDHTGGIEIVRLLGDVRVVTPASFFTQMKKKLSRFTNVEMVEVTETKEIAEGITSTGNLGRMGEQSLIVQTTKGLVVVTGCSHPGLGLILQVARQIGTIYGVLGGFHGFDELRALEGVEMIVPCHCTRQKKRILSTFPETSITCAAGCTFDV